MGLGCAPVLDPGQQPMRRYAGAAIKVASVVSVQSRELGPGDHVNGLIPLAEDAARLDARHLLLAFGEEGMQSVAIYHLLAGLQVLSAPDRYAAGYNIPRGSARRVACLVGQSLNGRGAAADLSVGDENSPAIGQAR